MKKYLSAALVLAVVAVLACLTAACKVPKPVKPITTEEIAAHIKYLSDDLLEGRKVGTRGIEIAAKYQEDFFKTFGLEPAFGGSYRQAFPLRGSTPDQAASLELASPKLHLAPKLWEQFVVATDRDDLEPEVTGDLVYCGYLIQAPERNWDDLKGLDVKGKVLLCEINEPGNYPGGIFDGEDMTYYGRWTYKFEKAAALGAVGCLIIHNTKGAAYDWGVVRNSWSLEGFFLPDNTSPLAFRGWIAGDVADDLFKGAGLDRQAVLAKAETPDFTPIPLNVKVKVRQQPKFRTVDGVNVAGIIKAGAKDARHKMIIISAHYDHLGKDDKLDGDKIYNGAIDNCSASASMLALASYYAQRKSELKDDLCIVGVTAEEEGLLGSDYFARHLPFPREKVLADINFEMTNVFGEAEDVYAVGASHSELDAICRQAAERMGLEYIAERQKNLGMFFRSDQLSFVKAGIPAVWLNPGIRSKGPDKDHIVKELLEYQKNRYHKVTDQFNPDWDLRGCIQIIDWARQIINILGTRDTAPQFLPSSPFGKK